MSTRYSLPMPYDGEEPFERDRRLFISSLEKDRLFFLQHIDKTTDTFTLKENHRLSIPWEMRLEQLNEMGTTVYAYLNTEKVINGVAVYMGERNLWDDLLPSIIIRYAIKKICAIWLTEDTPSQGLVQLQEGLKKRYKKSKINELVPMPGFYAKKYLIKIVHYSGEIFTFRQLTEQFPPKKR